MNPAAEIESVARSYLEGERTLSQLEEWLAPNLPILFELPEYAFASRLAARIELAMAEMDAEGLGEDHLRNAIRDLLPAESVIVVILSAVPGAVADTVFSSNTVEQARLSEPPEIRVVLSTPV
jgi:hypothetical protein